MLIIDLNYSNNDILQFALQNGMLDLAYMKKQMDMKCREEILAKHPYKIWQGETDKKWYTYLPDEEKGRKTKKRMKYDDLIDDIISFYREKEENPTVKEIYEEWVLKKVVNHEISVSTKNRYDRTFKFCYTEFAKRNIKGIEEVDIEDFVLSTISNNELTAKEYANFRTILYGIFKRAKKKKFIKYNIKEVVDDIDISKKMFRRVVHEDAELIFMKDEIPVIMDYLINQKPDLVNLGLLLMFKSGLRPGELAGLKKCDIENNVIHVRRTEIRYETEDNKYVYEVRDFPKTEAGIRDVVIPLNSMWILKDIRKKCPFGEFVFEKNGERLKTNSFSKRLKLICDKTGIVPKSPNKIRKTYATILLDNNVDESIVIAQMGHTDIKTTKQYYYKNRNNIEQRAVIIDNVSGL